MTNRKKINEFSSKRQKGIYETPYNTARHMVELVLPHITIQSKILDPCAGDGIFVQILTDSGVNSSQIFAHDIDEKCIEPLKKMGINAECRDTLLDEYPKMDIIIGNPPFKSRRNNIYMKKYQKKLEEKYGFVGLYNLYSLFVVNTIWHLKNGGVLCFIIEDAFLTNRYYYRFRKFLLENCKILEIKLAPWRLFHGSNADVRTAIITLQKRKKISPLKKISLEEEKNQKVRLIDRLADENEYKNPPRVQIVPQIEFHKMPDLKFFVGVPKSIIRLVQNHSTRFGNIAKGGTGISTGNDHKYLRLTEEVKNNPRWVGFYKSGQRTPYYYRTPYYIEKNYQKNVITDPKNFLVRNEQFYFREGITCSSVGRRFSAAYLPPGNLFGVNANFFFDNKEDLFFCLGFLNSKLVQYLARKVINRSNIIATSFLKEIPFIVPNIEQRADVAAIVKKIVKSLKKNPKYCFDNEAERIDKTIFDMYRISEKVREEILEFCANIMDMA